MKPSRTRTRLPPAQRREQILEAAIGLIGERGYYGFGIQELAQRCGLTNPGLLHYFGSKDQLLIALLQDRDRRDAEVVTSIAGLSRRHFDGAPLTLRQVVDLLHATVERNAAQPELIRLYAVLQAEALNPAHPAHDYFLARETATLQAFASLLRPHLAEPEWAARQLVALMLGLEQQWLRADQAFDIVAAWDRAAALLLPHPKTSRSDPA